MACFGPLLMGWVAVTLVGSIDVPVLVYSAPIGLLTENILHANNARDVENDARAGAKTLAQALGRDGSYYFYILLLAARCAIVLLRRPPRHHRHHHRHHTITPL